MFIWVKGLLISLILAASVLAGAQCGARPIRSTQTSAVQASPGQGLGTGMTRAELTPVSLKNGARLRVVATTNILADLVSNVGGDAIELTILLPAGADPHTFAPSPRDAAAIAEAHVVLINGLGLEEFLRGLIENAGSEVVVVATAGGIETKALSQTAEHSHQLDSQGPEETRAQLGVDPHVWMTPANAIVMVRNIEQTLSALDPANAGFYAGNAAAYTAQLAALDVWVKDQIGGIPPAKRKLITDHDSLGYYAERYGLDVIGAIIPAYSTNAEPSAQDIAALQDKIKQYDVKAVFVGMTVNPTLARQLTEDTGIELVSLYTGSLGPAGSGAATYVDLIRYNTTAIVEALR